MFTKKPVTGENNSKRQFERKGIDERKG